MTATERFLALCREVCEAGTLKKLIFSVPRGDAPRKTVGRLVTGRDGVRLACEETLDGGKVRHTLTDAPKIEAFLAEKLANYDRVNLISGAGDCEFRRSKNGKETVNGAPAVEGRLRNAEDGFTCYITSLDRQKDYALSGKEDFLIRLGVSDATGRVHDKKQGKFRQINRFLEHIEDIYPHLPKDGVLHIYDLCCGKSYLSFAVYYYLRTVKGREVDMFCMDLKEDVIRYCRGVAEAVGFSGMRFAVGDIRLTPKTPVPDLVISLHACDIATDIVLDTAIELGAKVILSTPCCHRYLTDRVKMPDLAFVTEHPYLRGKLAEVLTEGIRLARLKANGYRAVALEMTDPDDTPKNTLLRAVRDSAYCQDSPEAQAVKAEYQALLERVMGSSAEEYLKEIKL